MAEVWMAQSSRGGELVAVKSLRLDAGRGDVLDRDLSAVARLTHPNIT
jgi:hypothetical protein